MCNPYLSNWAAKRYLSCTDVSFAEFPMNLNFLEFEQPIAELEAKIDELHYVVMMQISISMMK